MRGTLPEVLKGWSAQEGLYWAYFPSQQSELCKKTSREQPMLRILHGFGPSGVWGVSADCVHFLTLSVGACCEQMPLLINTSVLQACPNRTSKQDLSLSGGTAQRLSRTP